jgi:hypothetical protein
LVAKIWTLCESSWAVHDMLKPLILETHLLLAYTDYYGFIHQMRCSVSTRSSRRGNSRHLCRGLPIISCMTGTRLSL